MQDGPRTGLRCVRRYGCDLCCLNEHYLSSCGQPRPPTWHSSCPPRPALWHRVKSCREQHTSDSACSACTSWRSCFVFSELGSCLSCGCFSGVCGDPPIPASLSPRHLQFPRGGECVTLVAARQPLLLLWPSFRAASCSPSRADSGALPHRSLCPCLSRSSPPPPTHPHETLPATTVLLSQPWTRPTLDALQCRRRA